jgi:hypothetical protein
MVGMSDETHDDSRTSHEDRFDEWLKEAARSYNRPPDIPPKDAIWEAIADARGERRAPRGDESIAASPELAWLTRAVRTPWLAAAAVLLLAVGIGIGRLSLHRSPASAVRNPEITASRPSPLPPDSSSPLGARRSPLAASSSPGSTESGSPVQVTAYDVVAARHFTAVEALLTSFAAEKDTSMDASMRRWASDLLSTTRLLLDSPAGRNADRRRLLQDLELVLVQMAQPAPRNGSLDRDLIDHAIARRQVLTRIRSSIPAGTPSGM